MVPGTSPGHVLVYQSKQDDSSMIQPARPPVCDSRTGSLSQPECLQGGQARRIHRNPQKAPYIYIEDKRENFCVFLRILRDTLYTKVEMSFLLLQSFHSVFYFTYNMQKPAEGSVHLHRGQKGKLLRFLRILRDTLSTREGSLISNN